MYSVSVDSRQVSEAVKGLKAVTHRKCRPPTGRTMIFITKSTDDVIDWKNEMILTQPYEAICNERRLYCQIDTPLMDKVFLQGRKSCQCNRPCGLSQAVTEDNSSQEQNVWEHRYSGIYLSQETSSGSSTNAFHAFQGTARSPLDR